MNLAITEPADSAILAYFEQNERRGWPHTEIDRWVWNGAERSPYLSKRLIDNNHVEFQELGRLTTLDVGNLDPQGGRPYTVYLLNYEQAVLYCTLSKGPRAAGVRVALIRTHVQLIRGELVPVTTEAVAETRGLDQMTTAITDLARIVGSEIAGLTKIVGSGFTSVKEDISELRDSVSDVQTRLTIVETNLTFRKRPKRQDLEDMICVVRNNYAGKCPCCHEVVILNSDGDRNEQWNVDHAYGNHNNNRRCLWAVCRSCNALFEKYAQYRSDRMPDFIVFQRYLNIKEDNQLKLFMPGRVN
jgi:hypothetical protein